MSEPGYFPHRQALRAFAVAGPMLAHLWPGSVPDSPLTARITGIGVLGVDLFFVISGFLITGILLDARSRVEHGQGTVRGVFAAFYARRTLRIFPVYWLLLIALAAAGVADVRGNFAWEFSYLTNVLIALRAEWLAHGESHFWSLAVEEQFYLAWPLAILLLPRRALAPAMVAVIAMAPLFRWYAVNELSIYHATVLTPACMDMLGLGALLALLWRLRAHRPAVFNNFVHFAGITGTAGTAYYLSCYLQQHDTWIVAAPLARTCYALLFTALVARAAEGFGGGMGRLAELAPVVYLGTISYAIYLFHPLVAQAPLLGRVLAPLAGQSPVAFFVAQVALTVAAAAVSWHWLEKPVNARRRRFPYAGSSKAPGRDLTTAP
jgi:peptidoglycan/LPS O-acetylase OafA/YrhL